LWAHVYLWTEETATALTSAELVAVAGWGKKSHFPDANKQIWVSFENELWARGNVSCSATLGLLSNQATPFFSIRIFCPGIKGRKKTKVNIGTRFIL